MIIIRLLAPLLLAVLTWWGLRWCKNRFALTTGQFRWLVVGTSLLLVVLILIVMGRLPVQALLAPLVFLGSFLLRNLHLVIRLWPLLRQSNSSWGRNKAAKGASTIATAWLAMSLDHATGNMDGEVQQGQFQKKRLSELTLEQLFVLVGECQHDHDSLQLLQAYLDRMHPDWRESASATGDAAGEQKSTGYRVPTGDSTMTEALALEILGLAQGATRQEIIAAHRRLMQKLHPDRGGSDYLAQRINAARDFLLD
jgi:hypothetical protein